jgi:putative membrane protein
LTLDRFPALNASLNAASAALLVLGFALVRSGRREAHRFAMLGAFGCSAVFLGCYLWYHFHHGATRFQGTGAVRAFYLVLLASHTVLATIILPVILRTLWLAASGRVDEHRRWARWAFPSWLYVSTTGVAVYWMLYRL